MGLGYLVVYRPGPSRANSWKGDFYEQKQQCSSPPTSSNKTETTPENLKLNVVWPNIIPVEEIHPPYYDPAKDTRKHYKNHNTAVYHINLDFPNRTEKTSARIYRYSYYY